MAENTDKTESTDKTGDVVHRAVDLSDEVLKSSKLDRGPQSRLCASSLTPSTRRFLRVATARRDTKPSLTPPWIWPTGSSRRSTTSCAASCAARAGRRKGVNDRRVHLDAERDEREAPIDEGVHPTTPQ
jgi:hypothetical protein